MGRDILRVENFHPSIGSVYRVVEGYLGQLTNAVGALSDSPRLTLQPIDALLIHLLARYQSVRPSVADLAAVATWGASTVLCRTDSAMCRIVVPRAKAAEHWRSTVDHYLNERDTPLIECVEVDGTREALERLAESDEPSLVIAPSEDRTGKPIAEIVDKWLEQVPRAVVVLLGVGRIGDCFVLASLAARCTGSPYRLALMRELAPTLAESRIALVGRRENLDLESSLKRIAQLFASQFRFLDLIERVYDSALEQSDLNTPVRLEPRAGMLELKECKTPYDWRRVVAQRDHELWALRQVVNDLKGSFTFQLLQHARRLMRKLAPEGSARRRLAHLARSALRRYPRSETPPAEQKPAIQPRRKAS